MKTLCVVFLVGICFLSKPCAAEESTTQVSKRVLLNLTLIPLETNLPSFDTGKPVDGARPEIEVMIQTIQTLRGKYSISSDASAPIFVRISPRAVSIRFEWSFK